MDFTREPVIETVITPKEGCKLAVRNSKGAGQEEYFVDAVEVVSYGNAYFFRSLERPKSFFVPVTDYEILEVRETRMVLKNIGIDRTIKIGSSKEPSHQHKQHKEPVAVQEKSLPQETPGEAEPMPLEPRADRKRERRRQLRRRRGKDDNRDVSQPVEAPQEDFDVEETSSSMNEADESSSAPREEKKIFPSTPHLILEPPKTLISETISRYRENGLYQEAFFERASKEEPSEKQENGSDPAPGSEKASNLAQPEEGDEAFNRHKEDAGKVAGFPYGWESTKLDEQSLDVPLEDSQSIEESDAEQEENKLTHRKENPYFHLTQDSPEP